MKKILIFTLILIVSCSQAESILEKEDSELNINNSMLIYIMPNISAKAKTPKESNTSREKRKWR